MIALGLRLSLSGGREALVRLVLTAVAVAIGVGLLLVTLAGINAVGTQNDRYAWLQTGAGSPPAATAADPMWWMVTADHFDGELIGRVDLAVTGPDSPALPGIASPPGPGEIYASPAMAELLAAAPAEQLGDRYDGRLVGIIGDEALPGPDSLVVMIGHEAGELSASGRAQQIQAVSTVSPADCSSCAPGIGINAAGTALVLSVVAAALVLPVLIFIGSATRLSAARREQRFAAMRLVGATPGQVRTVSVVESVVASTLGVLLGFGIFALVRPALAQISFTGTRFFLADLALSAVDVVGVVVGVPLAAAVVARLALRRVTISPLGVSRRVTPAPPSAFRLIPLALGIGELAYFGIVGRPGSTNGQVLAYLPGILMVMIGLVVAGPWLTMVGSRLIARRTSRPAVLIAGRRLADDPRAGFRAVSGLILALFVGTTAVAIVSTFTGERGAPPVGSAAAGTLAMSFTEVRQVDGPPTTVPASLLADLAAVPGVDGALVLRESPSDARNALDLAGSDSYVDCAGLAQVSALGRCADGAEVALISFEETSDRSDVVWPAAPLSAADLYALAPVRLVVGTDGTLAAVEQARTIINRAYPGAPRGPTTGGEGHAQSTREMEQYQLLATVVVAISLVVAGCSLAVSVAGGLSDRRRPFSLLRLSGVPLAMLRRVVALEAAVPLLIGALVAIGAGLLTAQLFLRSQLDYSLHAPGGAYYVAVVLGLAGALALIGSTFPLLARITGPEAARNE
ncbi:FtsX-like permease family protein [Sanguibacter gelidistatuariae]|uniref:FtsX-like permease family protein n=1 Tax=Sanguibacter gelidistatuariae TaxID=1814289 RepID=A0A1G6TPE4_9MICO|nr:ABC transporter permease [Sanguibacter gelidistatuariae]SDD30983.1 FtsX-like permease family protein [Sanguibacter gelidistatuariae]